MVNPSTLGNPGDAVGGDDFERPRLYGYAAGVRAVERVLGGEKPPLYEREGRSVTGGNLGRAGFPGVGGTL